MERADAPRLVAACDFARPVAARAEALFDNLLEEIGDGKTGLITGAGRTAMIRDANALLVIPLGPRRRAESVPTNAVVVECRRRISRGWIET